MQPTPTDLRLLAIKTRLQRVTPGPWEVSLDTSARIDGGASMITAPPGTAVACGIEEHRDAEFIAQAPADLAWLLDLVVSLTRPPTPQREIEHIRIDASRLIPPTDPTEALPPDRSIRLPGGPRDAVYVVSSVRAPGERLILTLTLCARARGPLQPLALQVLEATDPVVQALLQDHDNALRTWAAGKLRELAHVWDQAGGGA